MALDKPIEREELVNELWDLMDLYERFPLDDQLILFRTHVLILRHVSGDREVHRLLRSLIGRAARGFTQSLPRDGEALKPLHLVS